MPKEKLEVLCRALDIEEVIHEIADRAWLQVWWCLAVAFATTPNGREKREMYTEQVWPEIIMSKERASGMPVKANFQFQHFEHGLRVCASPGCGGGRSVFGKTIAFPSGSRAYGSHGKGTAKRGESGRRDGWAAMACGSQFKLR